MNKTLIILKHELRETLKKRSFLIITIALPLIAVLSIGIYQAISHLYQPPAKETRIGYIDESGVVSGYTQQSGVVFVSFTSQEDAKAAMLKNGITEYYVIPQDYLTTGVLSRFTLSRDFAPSVAVSAQLDRFLISNLLDKSVSTDVAQRVQSPGCHSVDYFR